MAFEKGQKKAKSTKERRVPKQWKIEEVIEAVREGNGNKASIKEIGKRYPLLMLMIANGNFEEILLTIPKLTALKVERYLAGADDADVEDEDIEEDDDADDEDDEEEEEPVTKKTPKAKTTKKKAVEDDDDDDDEFDDDDEDDEEEEPAPKKTKKAAATKKKGKKKAASDDEDDDEDDLSDF